MAENDELLSLVRAIARALGILPVQKPLTEDPRAVDPMAAIPPSAAPDAAWIKDPVTGKLTRQFGFAPTGTNLDGSPINGPTPNTMPRVDARMGVGALVRQKNVPSQEPHTVVAGGGEWFVRAIYTNPNNPDEVHTIELPPDQLFLIQSAPGT